MARFSSALTLFLLLLGCRNAASPSVDSPPPAEGPIVPFFVLPELLDIDPYPGGAQKDVGPAMITNTPQRRPEPGALDHVLLVFSKVPLDRFQTDAAPAVWKELHLPYDVGVVWRPGFFDASVQAVVVSTHPLASFEDVESAEPSESHEQSVEIKNGKMTQREAAHLGVRVTLGERAKARIAKYASEHRGHPLIVAYDGWAAGFGKAGEEDGTFDFRFSWLDDESAADHAAKDFIAKVSHRRSRH